MKKRELEQQVRDLEDRVEGLESLMSEHVTEGRFIAVTRSSEDNHLAEAAKQAERELQTPAPDRRY